MHNQRKLLNFESWCNGGRCQKIWHWFRKWSDLKIDIIRNVDDKYCAPKLIFFNEIINWERFQFCTPAWKFDNPYNHKCLFMPLALVFPFIHCVWISFSICFLSACSFVSFFIQHYSWFYAHWDFCPKFLSNWLNQLI